ncbi:MAG: ATP-dependent zinc metalloprotease FtsH [Pseudomonadota bacterium]
MNPFLRNAALWVVILLAMILLFHFMNPGPTQTEMSYSSFLDLVEQGKIQAVSIKGVKVEGRVEGGSPMRTTKPADDQHFIEDLRKNKVEITVEAPSDSLLLSGLIQLLPIGLLVVLWIFFMRQMQSGGGKAMSFGKSRARLLSESSVRVTFEDVAGIEEAKEELVEVVEFLRDPKKFTRLGGRIPKGVLLVGAPGSGKTLLARAIAGEAEVPFFSISGSDFVEMFVGVGASRVRDLFLQGKKHAPCIIFIDEIDAVGRHRGAGLGGGHDEREQTLNQLLVEMDGFESNEGVILISATNRPDVLDPALLRPGRFDRQVVVPLPDILGRERIFQVHMRKTPLADDVDVGNLARGTPGFSGADLENLVNEAALLAAKRGRDKVHMADFEDAKDKVYMGLERKSKVMSKEDLTNTAYHEAGHALVARFLPETDAVNKITIIPRGRALGVTWFLPEERDTIYRDQLQSRLAVSFGGRVAEELVFSRISTGAANDISQATQLAQRMIRDWGMSDELGPLSYSQHDDQVFLGKDISRPRDYSEDTARKIDEEIRTLALAAYARAREILQENMEVLHKLAAVLLEKETVMGPELDEIIRSIKPDTKLSAPHSSVPRPKADPGNVPEPPPLKREASAAEETDAPEEPGDSEGGGPEEGNEAGA